MNLYEPFTQLSNFKQRFSLLARACFSAFILFHLWGCGGDEEAAAPAEETSSEGGTGNEATSIQEDLDDAPLPETLEVEPENNEPIEAPDPNGVFLPVYETQQGKMEMVKLNDQPVYSNGQGYFLWSNGSLWKITTKPGSGRTVASGGGIIEWMAGQCSARHSPDEEYAKQAMFRLAVAYQGSQDNENAIRLFNQFVTLFPDDKLVAEVYLSMGDLATSGLGPDRQPNIKQIRQALDSYGKVRLNTEEIGLISDSTANELDYLSG